MNTRERLHAVFHWKKPDRVPCMDFGYWNETIAAWHSQGLPETVKTSLDLERFLGLEGVETIPFIPVTHGLFPCFDEQVLEDRGDHLIKQDCEGNICEVSKHNPSIPRYIKFGIETRDDWERYKAERLDYTRVERVGDVTQCVAEAHAVGMPVRFFAGSLYGWLRNWLGLENFSMALMTDRGWVEEMLDHLTTMTLYFINTVLPGVAVDAAVWWEDMCYNKGPLMSPALFEELLVPRYRRVTDELKKYGVDVNIVDCDGCIYELVPGWIRAGINCMFPIEAAHTDPRKLREMYGKDILLFGGVDKRRLIAGKEAIDRELERVADLVSQGGYIPTIDHLVPPDVTFENYLYYVEQKKKIL
jgi:uroporphyrinogen-III decarboxylase